MDKLDNFGDQFGAKFENLPQVLLAKVCSYLSTKQALTVISSLTKSLYF